MVDLHLHTNLSDGAFAPEAVLRLAEKADLSLISVTDHNTVAAYPEIEKNRTLFSGRIINGVELNTDWCGEGIEILGYGIDIPTMRRLISENYYSFRDKQLKECAILYDAFLQKGVRLGDEFLYAIKHHPETVFDPDHRNSRDSYLAEMKKYPENARFFLKPMDEVTIRDFSREYVFNPASPLFVKTGIFPDLDRAASLIRKAGGRAYLAHLYEYTPKVAAALPEIAEKLDGIECYYTTFTKSQTEFLVSFCGEHHLGISGGSDFHGEPVKPNEMGKATAGEPISETQILL